MLEHTLKYLLRGMRLRAQVASSLAEHILLTRYIALYSLAFDSMRRGYNISSTMGFHIWRLPASKGLIFNYQFGKTLRASLGVLAGRDCLAICAFRTVTAYISAAQRIGWDLSTGYLFPVATAEGGRGHLSPRGPYGGEPAKLSANGRPAEPLHDAFLSSERLAQQIPGRDGCGRDHENWWLEDRVSCKVLHRGYLEWTSAG